MTALGRNNAIRYCANFFGTSFTRKVAASFDISANVFPTHITHPLVLFVSI